MVSLLPMVSIVPKRIQKKRQSPSPSLFSPSDDEIFKSRRKGRRYKSRSKSKKKGTNSQTKEAIQSESDSWMDPGGNNYVIDVENLDNHGRIPEYAPKKAEPPPLSQNINVLPVYN